MWEISYVSDLWKSISLVFSIGYIIMKGNDITRVIVITLVLLCLFTLQFFIDSRILYYQLHNRTRAMWLKRINICISILSIFIIIKSNSMELTSCSLILMISIIRDVKEDLLFYSISSISCFLYCSIEEPGSEIILLSLLFILGYSIQVYMAKKLKFYKTQSLKQRQSIIDLEAQLSDNKKLMKTIHYAATLEERNRMAARLHDKIGHNISGSILMLEASLLQMEKNPEKAMEEVSRTVEHLREGVDDLRHALREERPIKSDINSNDIQLLLEQAQMEHGIHTIYKTDGNLEQITMEQWQCIKENVTELMTNTLKHSKATVFTVHIRVLPSMLQVIYSDNGSCSPDFEKGLGLEAIEERTIRLNGRCFFEGSELGFKVTNIFIMRSNG